MSSVSFVVPVFNKAKYLKTVIKSLRLQTGNFDKEYIFVNDGSTDNSLEILQKEIKSLKNCKIISQKNKGSASATNVGIRASEMKYIKFLDADDLIINKTTLILLDLLEKNKKFILAYGLQRKVVDISSVKLDDNLKNLNITYQNNPIKLAMRNSMFNPSQFLVRTDICKMVGGCDERFIHSQEYSLTLRLANIGNFIRLNYPLAILPMQAPGQISEKKNNQIYRVSKSLELFIEDNSKLNLNIKLYAQRRLTARAWRFVRGKKNRAIYFKYFLLYLIGLFRVNINPLKICIEANKVYKKYLD